MESYSYTVTAPIRIYYTQPIYCSGYSSYRETWLQGLEEVSRMLKKYREQHHKKLGDDLIVIAYLKGYGDKGRTGRKRTYGSNLENYAYALGKQGDYMEEGLTEDDIVLLARNEQREEEKQWLE